jgi:hypothetical protein
MRVFAYALLGACAFALPASAQGLSMLADPQFYLRGSYVEVEGGSGFQGATTEYNVSPTTADKGSGHFRPGYFGGLVLGKRIAPGLSLELEGVYLNNHYDRATEFFQGVGGSERTYGGLGNFRVSLPYDYHVYRNFALVPYVGAGIGYGSVRYETSEPFYGHQGGFMWQAKTGVEVKTGTPISFDFGYRYIGTPEFSENGFGANAGFATNMRSHVQVATGGIKYTF